MVLQTLTSDRLFTRHGFFSRNGGVSEDQYHSLNASFFVGDRGLNVIKNRKILADYFEVSPERLFFPRQIHGLRVCLIRDYTKWHIAAKYHPRADALVSDSENVAIGVTTADCLPILMVDIENRVIAAVHGGWRSLLGGIIAKTIDAMNYLGASNKNICVAVGPCINVDSYQVGAEILEKLKGRESSFASKINDQTLLDLPRLTHYHLLRAKILDENICLKSACDTFTNRQFFSSRASKSNKEYALSVFSYGCQPSIISLNNNFS